MTSRVVRIMAECAARQGITVDEMISGWVIRNKAKARRNAAYRLKTECRMSSAQIARRLRIRNIEEVDAMIRRKIADIERLKLFTENHDQQERQAATAEAAAINKYWCARGIDAQARVVRKARGEYVVRSNINFLLGAKAAA